MVNENNVAILSGWAISEPVFSHEAYSEKFYSFIVASPRLSGENDEIVVTASDRLMPNFELLPVASVAEGAQDTPTLQINGQFRSYNSYKADGSSHLLLTLFAKDIITNPWDHINEEIPAGTSPAKEFINSIELSGFICKTPIFRHTPFGREICDILVAVNRSYNKSDYIPAICWGRTARYAATLEVGTPVEISGRIQSRRYQKYISPEQMEERTAYEVSVIRLQ